MIPHSFAGQHKGFFGGVRGGSGKFLSQEEKDLERERESPPCAKKEPIERSPGPGTAPLTAGNTGHTPFCSAVHRDNSWDSFCGIQ